MILLGIALLARAIRDGRREKRGRDAQASYVDEPWRVRTEWRKNQIVSGNCINFEELGAVIIFLAVAVGLGFFLLSNRFLQDQTTWIILGIPVCSARPVYAREGVSQSAAESEIWTDYSLARTVSRKVWVNTQRLDPNACLACRYTPTWFSGRTVVFQTALAYLARVYTYRKRFDLARRYNQHGAYGRKRYENDGLIYL